MPESKRALGTATGRAPDLDGRIAGLTRRRGDSNLAKVDATTYEDKDIARQIAEDPDTAPELTEDMLADAEVWHGDRFIRRIGRPKGSGKKELVTLRLDREILEHFRATGPGWQTRLNDALQEVARGRGNARRPQRGTNAKLIAEVLKAMPSGTARPAEIRKALQSGKGVQMAFTSIRDALGQLETRHEVAPSDDGKTWRYLGQSS